MKPTFKIHEEPSEPSFFHSQGFGLTVLAILAIGLIAAIILHKYQKN